MKDVKIDLKTKAKSGLIVKIDDRFEKDEERNKNVSVNDHHSINEQVEQFAAIIIEILLNQEK